MRRTVLQLVFALALFLVTAEVAVRVVIATPATAERLVAESEAGRRLVMVDHASRQGHSAFFGTRTVAFDPTLGWVGRPDAVDPGPPRVTTTALGARTTTDTPRAGPRVLVLGDSFTFGHEVVDADTWAWQLSERTGADVIDLAVLGYGLDQMVLRAEQVLPTLRPAHVVVGLNHLELARAVRRWDSWAKPRLLLVDGALVRDPPGPMPSPETLVPALAWPRLPAWLDVLVDARTGLHDAETAAPLVEPLLARLASAAGEVGAAVTVVWLPVPEEIGRAVVPPSVTDAPCVRSGLVQLVDTSAAFDAARAQGTELVVHTHWSRAGHAVVADVLAPRFTARAPPSP